MFWNGDNSVLDCNDLGLAPGERHEICRGDDPDCVYTEPYQDCVRGPNACKNADAVMNYTSEIEALKDLNVERLSIGIGNDSRVEWGSALWIIDNNPAKYLGVLPLQALTLEELSLYLSNLCILNTDPPTGSPSSAPSGAPSISSAPSFLPSKSPSESPSKSAAPSPSATLSMLPSNSPSLSFAPSVSMSPTNLCQAITDDDIEDSNSGPYGEIKFCLRSSYGYRYGIANSFREVNFIESLITIRYDLKAGFCVRDFNVEPKERLEDAVQGGSFELEAWLCDTALNQARTSPDRIVPAEIDPTYIQEYSDVSNATYFNQGSLISVCVAPDDEAYSKNMRMDRISSFDWKRDDLNATAASLPLSERIKLPSPIFQQAIENGAPSANGLTSYNYLECFGAEYCHFSSILFADFYISRGVVYGDGSAVLKFGEVARRGRKLKATENTANRQLQEDSTESSFGVAVPVNGIGDDFNVLETAGCEPFGFKNGLIVPVISSIVAFLMFSNLL